MANQVLGKIIGQEEAAPGIYFMEILAPEIAAQAKPGQFVHVKCGSTYAPLLRRPISLHSIEPQVGKIGLLYQIKGQGTKLLAGMRSGQAIDLLGPLGNGFQLPAGLGKALVIGGGMGVAPLLPLLQALQAIGKPATAILGFNDSSSLLRVQAYASCAEKLLLTTVDGSAGEKGLATAPLERELQTAEYSIVFACGPEPMLRAVTAIADSQGIECQVSLEAYMACGIGACLGCACRTREEGQERYTRVCCEGPVYDSKAVIWNE